MAVLGCKTKMDSLTLHALSPVYNIFLGFTSGATPADLLTAKSFLPCTCTSIQTLLVGLESRIKHASSLQHVTSGIPGGYRLVSTYDLPDFLKWGGGYFGVNFGHLKSEVFRNMGGG